MADTERGGVAGVVDRVPNTVLDRIERLVPDRFKPWRKKDGVVTFDEGHVQWSPSSPAEYHAKLYHEFEGIEGVLTHHCEVPFERSLEVGCGYGRLSPWLARLSGTHHAVDPNADAIETARTHYPGVQFREASAQELPYDDDSVDLVLIWNVLQHVPPKRIESALAELERVCRPDGAMLLMENTTDTESPIHWGRSREEYETLLGRRADVCEPRPVERTYDFAKEGPFAAADNHMMLFLGNSSTDSA